jgi:hypothetical protein
MPSVLDSFVLELGIDTTKFSKGQRDALDQMNKFEQEALRTGKSIEGQGTKVLDLFGEIRKFALLGIGAIAGGMAAKEFLGFVTNLDASTGRLAKTMNVSASELSAWQGAIKQVGGSAESANAALGGLSGEMMNFVMTGQSSILPVLSRLGVSLYDQNHNLKTAGQLWLDLSDAVKGMDPRQAAAFLQMIPGANQDMINFALLGRKAMEQYISSSREAGVTTRESAEEAQKYQKQLELLEQSATSLGRTLVTWLAPALTKILDLFKAIVVGINTTPESEKGKELNSTFRNNVITKFGSPGSLLRSWGLPGIAEKFYGPEGADEAAEAARAASGEKSYRAATGAQVASEAAQAAGARVGDGGVMPGYTASVADIEAYLRAAALKRGIDPNVAVGVYRGEGKSNYTGDQGTSFGPMQLHVGGGLGDEFKGNLRDPNTWREQIDFSLDKAIKTGWGPWHGWHGLPRQGLPSPGAKEAPRVLNHDKSSMRGGDSKTTTINVASVNINAPHATDAAGIAKEIGPALQRSLYAGAANYGQS